MTYICASLLAGGPATFKTSMSFPLIQILIRDRIMKVSHWLC